MAAALMEAERVDGIDEMMARLQAGDARALARAISLLEGGGSVKADVLRRCRATVREQEAKRQRGALRIGVTGAGGVGKSTLVDQMVRLLRQEGLSVGVLAIDPTSPYTGGALLGDRIRMQGFSGDAGVSIRSMATRGSAGGVGPAADAACWAMHAAGREVVLLETIGVGQDDVAVAGMANVVVVVLAPGMGDEVQAMKAGVMEAADVFVVNKADRGGAEEVEAEIAGMQGLSTEGKRSPVFRTIAATGEGVAALLRTVREIAKAQAPRASRGMEPPRVDHLGIAVRDLETARRFYEGIGLRAGEVQTVEHEGVRLLMLPAEESKIELLEALHADTVIGRFVAKRGEGLHHIALRTDDVDGLFARLTAEGVRLVSDAVKVGAGGHRYFFVHPAATGGVLVEMVGEAAE